MSKRSKKEEVKNGVETEQGAAAVETTYKQTPGTEAQCTENRAWVEGDPLPPGGQLLDVSPSKPARVVFSAAEVEPIAAITSELLDNMVSFVEEVENSISLGDGKISPSALLRIAMKYIREIMDTYRPIMRLSTEKPGVGAV